MPDVNTNTDTFNALAHACLLDPFDPVPKLILADYEEENQGDSKVNVMRKNRTPVNKIVYEMLYAVNNNFPILSRSERRFAMSLPSPGNEVKMDRGLTALQWCKLIIMLAKYNCFANVGGSLLKYAEHYRTLLKERKNARRQHQNDLLPLRRHLG
jgi:hypothetical protein